MINNCIALLPMKGHSERIKNKNLKNLAGKPLCFWILETLTACNFKEIIINTDSEDIAIETKKYFNVTIHERQKEICGDLVSMNHIIANDLTNFQPEQVFLQTHSTNPILKKETLINSYDKLKNSPKNDSAFSVTRHQSRFYNHLGNAVNHNPDLLVRTQDLNPMYEENSCFYYFSKNSFSKKNNRIGNHPLMIETNYFESIDLDEPWQWNLAEEVIRQGMNK